MEHLKLTSSYQDPRLRRITTEQEGLGSILREVWPHKIGECSSSVEAGKAGWALDVNVLTYPESELPKAHGHISGETSRHPFAFSWMAPVWLRDSRG